MGNVSEPKEYQQFVRKVRNLEDGTLEIPQTLVEKYKCHCSEYAFLEVSGGQIWKVHLKIQDGRVWLDEGWKKFVDDCSIQCEYTLLFRYEGVCLFRVCIFDTIDVEIKDPGKQRGKKIKEEVGDSSVQILLDWPSRTREITAQIESGTFSVAEGDEQARGVESPSPRFLVTIKPDYCSFLESDAGSFFNGREDNEMYLCGPDEKAWYLKYSVGESPVSRLLFISGWDAFLNQYNLSDGDSCMFELINTTVLIFKAILIQNIQRDGQGQDESDVEMSEEREVERAESNKPSFTLVYDKHRSDSLNRIELPAAHAETCLTKQHNKHAFIHGVGGKVWTVRLYHARSIARFTTGWVDFVTDNHLEDGDKCVFELESQAPNHYNVTIIRAAESAI